jgi:hypothetical protein
MTNQPWTLHEGDCLEWLRTLDPGSVDAVVTDPPYPGARREYGYWTPEEWLPWMREIVTECRRVLKPSGSAVFVLQPNSERIGRATTWLWEFMAEWGRAWNIVQDVWWWNYAMIPTAHCQERFGLARPSLKACVWLGSPDCYRDQSAVLWGESQSNIAKRADVSRGRENRPSGFSVDVAKTAGAALIRGGVTPFNVLPITNSNSATSGAAFGHGGATPERLCDYWVKYISAPGQLVIDPFAGSGTVGISAIKHGRRFAGAERFPKYWPIARARLTSAASLCPLFPAEVAG